MKEQSNTTSRHFFASEKIMKEIPHIVSNAESKLLKAYIIPPLWKRVCARLIDFIGLFIIAVILQVVAVMIYVGQTNFETVQTVIDVCLPISAGEIAQTPECTDFISTITWYTELALILSYIINNLYFIILPLTPLKTTLGKKLLSMSIVDRQTLTDINALQSISREIFWIIAAILSTISILFKSTQLDFLSNIAFALISVSFLQMFFNDTRQAWHDSIAQTLVVQEIKDVSKYKKHIQ